MKLDRATSLARASMIGLLLAAGLAGCFPPPNVHKVTDWFEVRHYSEVSYGIVNFRERRLEFCLDRRMFNRCIGHVVSGYATALDGGKAVLFGGRGNSTNLNEIIYRDSGKAREADSVFPYSGAFRAVAPEGDRLVFITPDSIVHTRQVHVVVTDIFGAKLDESDAELPNAYRDHDIVYISPKFSADGGVYLILHRTGTFLRAGGPRMDCRIARIENGEFQVIAPRSTWNTECTEGPWSQVLGQEISGEAKATFSAY